MGAGAESDRRRGGDDRGYGATNRGRAHTSRSPNGRKRRAVAADLFDDEREHDGHDRRHSRHHSNSRSKSPDTPSRHEHKRRKHHDERRRHHHHHHHSSKRSDRHDVSSAKHSPPVELPFEARQLSYKHDYDAFTALFAYYLDIQKGMDFYALDSHEARGRWKSFVHKWNRKELAEGWYDPEMYERITREDPARNASMHDYSTGDENQNDDYDDPRRSVSEDRERSQEMALQPGKHEDGRGPKDNDDDEDDYGPPPPPGQQSSSSGGPRHGPGIPSRADLAVQREEAEEAAQADLAALRLARKADRTIQKERLDELVPRAEAGTRERQLEKKALVNEKMRSFREKGDTMEEVGDKDLMGGGDDLAEYKSMMAAQQRKKTERELRREAEARAKAVEREERLREWKEREEEKLRGLKELAKARFG